MRILLASSNKGKLVELARLLPDHDVVGLPEGFVEQPETGATFAQNAEAKARYAASVTGEICVADDSGFVVAALNGMPGLLSARWAGRHGDDAANLALVLAQLNDVPDARRGASFVCAAAVAGPDGGCEVVHGVVHGTVLRAPRGDNGFGYDPIFVPHGSTRTTAELDAEAKDAISHRGQAMRRLAPIVASLAQRNSVPQNGT